MLCYVMLCYVMLCYVKLSYGMLCYLMLCYVMLWGVIWEQQTAAITEEYKELKKKHKIGTKQEVKRMV
jgi:hypothetical protein